MTFIDSRAIAATEAYCDRVERLIERLRQLHRFSVSEAIEFIERFGGAVDEVVDAAGDSRETQRTER